jgi:hypothetical protein
MDGFSLWRWIITAIVMALYVLPFFLILPKAGFSRAWILLGVLWPVGPPVLLWMVAVRPWPSLEARASTGDVFE